MSEAKGPYKHYRLCDEAPCVKGSCMACVYNEGRASRDGLVVAIKKAIEIIRNSFVNKNVKGNDWMAAWELEKALEADGEGK